MLQKIAVTGIAAALSVTGWVAFGAPSGPSAAFASPGLDDPDPFPFGVCVTAKRVDPEPLCVVVDPDRA